MSSVAQLLDERFRELGLFKNAPRARYLRTDESTYSRILNGHLTLSESRAGKWATLLFPAEMPAAADFQRRLLGDARPATVREFFDRMVAAGGTLEAGRMSDLLDVMETVMRPLLCIEYRDVPRAGPASKYEGLGSRLGQAVAHGVNVAMFQPFGHENPLRFLAHAENSNQSLSIATQLLQIQQKCRNAYVTFWQDALDECKTGGRRNKEPGDEELSDEDLIDRRLRLYERFTNEPFYGSGFQAKLFYAQYLTEAEGGASVRHQRILQWISTPRRDLLVYRGQADIDPDAIRDGFYPVGHFFDAAGYLPPIDPNHLDRDLAKRMPPAVDGPWKLNVWKSYVRPAGSRA